MEGLTDAHTKIIKKIFKISIVIAVTYDTIVRRNTCRRQKNMTTDAKTKKLNIAISEELHRQMKIAAAMRGETILFFVTESIRERVERLKKG